MFIIQDWAGNVCFHGKEFESFEDAWGYIYECFPNGDADNTYDEYFVVENQVRESRYLDPRHPMRHVKKIK